MAEHDGNGWVSCRCGSRHWGRYGAAGLVLLRTAPQGRPAEVLLQLRAPWTHLGGTWGLPGGARDSHEDVTAAALREAHEEADVVPALVQVLATLPGLDHADWRYTYVVALAAGDVRARPLTAESDELRWVALEQVADLPLHPSLAQAWPALAPAALAALAPLDAVKPANGPGGALSGPRRQAPPAAPAPPRPPRRPR